MKCKLNTGKSRNVPPDVSISLPSDYAWKVLGMVANDLKPYLQTEDFELITTIIRNRDFYAYNLLGEEWGLQCTLPACTVFDEFQARYILAALLKKYRFPSDDKERRTRALEKFLHCEAACMSFNREGYLKLVAPQDNITPVLFTYAREFLRKLLGESLPNHNEMTEWSRHGPGANLDTNKGRVSKYDKYGNFPYSCTIDAYRYARFAIATDQRWMGALLSGYRERFNIPMHYPINMEVFWSKVLNIVDGNRICFVPKNSQIDRSIAIEPAMNLYLQLGVDGCIRRRLKRFGIDLDDQTKNQRLARLGSIDDGYKSFVTLDLSSASDMVSLKLVELLFPKDWYDYLKNLRSPYGNVKDSSLVFPYEKISSMGNGYTFAIESAIFASAVFAVQKFVHGRYHLDRMSVFGDDIIVEKWISDMVVDLLSKFGFDVNKEKSFFKGPIRESCGTDWFQGRPIRPVFFDIQPKNVMDLLTDINRVDRLLSLRFGLETNASLKMEKWLPEPFRLLTGPRSDESFDTYRHSSMPDKRHIEPVNNVFKFRRLTVESVSLPGKDFLFRKLMHDLRPCNLVPALQRFERLPSTKSGSRFDITRRNALDVGYTYSVALAWATTYAEYIP